MTNITDEEIKKIIDQYKKKIGQTSNRIVTITEDCTQDLQQIIKEENEKIIKAVKLEGFGETARNKDFENILVKYHESEIANNKRVNILMIIVIIAGIVFFAIGIIGRIYGFLEDQSITVISGGILEIIGALIKGFQTQSDKNKYVYFKALDRNYQREAIVFFIKNMAEGKTKNRMIEKMMDGYYSDSDSFKY